MDSQNSTQLIIDESASWDQSSIISEQSSSKSTISKNTEHFLDDENVSISDRLRLVPLRINDLTRKSMIFI